MPEAEPNPPLERRTACDNCKARKTKCDRKSPCASCVTLNVACRTSQRASEKRQRVLLSSKYEEAVQDVSRQLADVREMLQTLTSSKDAAPCPPRSTETTPEYAHNTPRSMIDEQVPTLSSVHDGYNGDSSFQSHAHGVENALEATLAAYELINVDGPAILRPKKVRELLHDTGNAGATAPDHAASKISPRPHDFDLGNMPLPPLDAVLKLLRLSKTHKQQFFVDVTLLNEDEFTGMCRSVYFATEPISLWTWICTNVGLYFLFMGVQEVDCDRMGTTVKTMYSHCNVLQANAEGALQSLRLCSEPSTESCRALALLGTFYVKQGHSTIAWRLISGAARACLDLGLHRLPKNTDSHGLSQKHHLFWYIYSWEKGLAMTCGRTPIIHHYDVTSVYPLTDRVGFQIQVYGAFIDYAVVTGEIQQTLFSASAHHLSQKVRIQHVERFAARLKTIQKSVRYAYQEDPACDESFGSVAETLDIMMYSLLTIVYRILPPNSSQPHPLQCSDECIDAARLALSHLVKFGGEIMQQGPVRCGMMLNVVLSLVPFVSFIVLSGNAIATSSSADLALLSSVVSLLAPPAAFFPTIRKMHDACERFGRIASLIVSNANEGPLKATECQVQASNEGLPLGLANYEASTLDRSHLLPDDYGFPMAQQDWDSVMSGFESELGDYDSRTLTNIIEPYFANSGW